MAEDLKLTEDLRLPEHLELLDELELIEDNALAEDQREEVKNEIKPTTIPSKFFKDPLNPRPEVQRYAIICE